jgi:pantoate--beta-alanine ligase
VPVAIALGSNLGDREAALERAVAALRAAPELDVTAVSPWIETAPVGGPPGQPPFLSGALLARARLAARELLALLLRIEREHGRDRRAEARHGPRTLDLDLLLFDELALDEPGLVLPHPGLEERVFVLEPLARIAPGLRLPRSGRTVAERLAELRAAGPRAPLQRLSPSEARAWARAERAAGRTLGFVPTMGALHEGHLELVRRSVCENERTLVSVFVNPMQFDDPRDFERYPRDLEADARLLVCAGCDALFGGSLAEFFPECAADDVPREDPGPGAEGLEGASRPGHFAGVATIVARLFAIAVPDRAYFGEKDFQQTLVVRDLARRLGGPEIVVHPTSRDADGLARSSRNALLAPEARRRAPAVHRALRRARDAWRRGERDPAALRRAISAELADPAIELDYAAVRDPERWTAEEPPGPLRRARALVAARIGGVRLIDTLALDGVEDDA